MDLEDLHAACLRWKKDATARQTCLEASSASLAEIAACHHLLDVCQNLLCRLVADKLALFSDPLESEGTLNDAKIIICHTKLCPTDESLTHVKFHIKTY